MFAYWKLITTPLIGAVIGYITNWIAVKCCFGPGRSSSFWKAAPFYAGSHPKGKPDWPGLWAERWSSSFSQKRCFGKCSYRKKKRQRYRRRPALGRETERSEVTLRAAAGQLLSEEKTEDFIESAEETVTDVIFDRLLQMDVGEIIADKVLEIAKEKLKIPCSA